MRIQEIKIYRYRIPYVSPLLLGKKEYHWRKGLIVRLAGCGGIHAYGEVAPLPGFSKETLAQSERQLIRLCQSLLNQSIPEDHNQLWKAFQFWYAQTEFVPSVKFGLQMALLSLLSAIQQRPVAQLLRPHCPKSLNMTFLLTGTLAKMRKKASEIASIPYSHSVKIKVGRHPVEEEIKLIREVRRILGTKQICLDANRLWDFKTATYFGTQIADCGILYIEEPVPQLNQCLEFSQMTGIGFALDETLHHADYQFTPQKGLQALVAKPMLIGGIDKILKIACDAYAHQIPTIISSSYESSLGLTMLANLAAAIDSDIPVGLDTYGMFQYDLQKPGFFPNNGTLSLESLESRKNLVQDNRLEMIWHKSA